MSKKEKLEGKKKAKTENVGLGKLSGDTLDEQATKEEIEKLDKNIQRCKDQLAFLDGFESVRGWLVGCMIVCFIFSFIFLSGTRGSFGPLHKYEDPNTEVSVQAYYRISYEASDQITLSVFVRNDSGKNIESAVVREKGSNNTATVYSLQPGQEKIVTIDSYRSDSYEFEILDVKYTQ